MLEDPNKVPNEDRVRISEEHVEAQAKKASFLLKQIKEGLDPRHFTAEEVKDEFGTHAEMESEYDAKSGGVKHKHHPDTTPRQLQALLNAGYIEELNDGVLSLTEKGMADEGDSEEE